MPQMDRWREEFRTITKSNLAYTTFRRRSYSVFQKQFGWDYQQRQDSNWALLDGCCPMLARPQRVHLRRVQITPVGRRRHFQRLALLRICLPLY